MAEHPYRQVLRALLFGSAPPKLVRCVCTSPPVQQRIFSVKEDHVFYSAVHPHEGQRKFVLRGLDGIRAIAVLLVVVYHFWPQALPGGMIGVDIFFVISGYLITALLLREGAYTGKMNIVAFWVRRLRRLIPAVMLLVLVISTVALMVSGDAQVGLGRQILGAFTYSSNWLLIWAGNDYFTQTSPELMTNFWSLAVEEQFYFFWPVIMVFVFMFTAKWWQRSLVPAVLGTVSLLLTVILAALGASTTRLYYGTDTHLYGLMVGVLLAMLLPWSMYPPADERLYPIVGYGNGAQGWIRQATGWVSLLLVVPLALTLSDANPALLMPWGLLAGSLLGLGMIQALLPDVRGGTSGAFRALLSFPPLVWVGQRSYGIYLWHWPLMVLAHYIFGPVSSPWVNAVVLLLTLLCAGASYIYVEQPVRTLGFRGALGSWLTAIFARTGRAVPVTAAVLACLTLIATVFAVRTAPHMTQAQALIAAGQAAQEEHQQEPVAAPDESPQPDEAPTPYAIPEGVSVVGDSVTLAAAGVLANRLPEASIDGEVSRTSSKALPLIKQQAEEGKLPTIVVLSVTANSTFSAEELDQLHEAVVADGERRLVLVTGRGPASLPWIEPSNQIIRDFAAAHPDTVSIADWQAASEGHPEYLVSDGVHPQGQGLEVYAQTIADAVQQAEANLAESKLPPEQVQGQ